MAEKGRRGGKYSNNKVSSKTQGSRGKEVAGEQYESRTYTFYDPKLGMKQITARNKKQAITKARSYGYNESDLREY